MSKPAPRLDPDSASAQSLCLALRTASHPFLEAHRNPIQLIRSSPAPPQTFPTAHCQQRGDPSWRGRGRVGWLQGGDGSRLQERTDTALDQKGNPDPEQVRNSCARGELRTHSSCGEGNCSGPSLWGVWNPNC